jgi:disulfide bond formation protein DsbB
MAGFSRATSGASLTADWMQAARARPVMAAAMTVAVVGAATILGAWFFQYGLGLKPCPLCLEQRYPYYFAIPLAVMVLLGEQVGSSRKVLLGALGAIALGMLWNAGLATYHAGVEWKWWAGPQDCSGALDNFGTVTDLLRQLETMSPVRCDEAAWRFLGMSLAGYNALIALALAGVAAWGVRAGLGQRSE